MQSAAVAVLVVLVRMCCGANHTDLKVTDGFCPLLHSCERDTQTDLSPLGDDPGCFCDGMCQEYSDCCLDADYNVSRYRENRGKHRCVRLRQYGNVYMRGTCGDGWQDEEVSRLCLSGSPESSGRRRDPVGNTPVTSLTTSVTYSNYYCAICNGERRALRMWSTRWECPTLVKLGRNLAREDIISNLVYGGEEWGVSLPSNGTVEFHGCFVYPVLPAEVSNMTRKCFGAITTCAEGWSDASVADLCHSYTAVVFSGTDSYENPHCATCNNMTQEGASCIFELTARRSENNFFSFEAFALLLDFTDASGSNVVGSTSNCPESEVWDPFFNKCRSVVCAKLDHHYRHGECVPNGDLNATVSTEPSTASPPTSASTDSVEVTQRNNSSSLNARDNNPIVFPGETTRSTLLTTTTATTPSPSSTMPISNTAMSSNESAESLDCNRIFLNEEEFSAFGNGTVFVEAYGRTYLEEEYEAIEGGGILVCSPQASTRKFSQTMGWVSLVGLSLSSVCLLLHLAVFLLLPDFRSLCGKNLASLCLALVASYVTFIVNVFAEPDQTSCVILAAAMYYFFLSSFTWMSAVAFDIWYTFRLTKTELRVTSGKQWCKFLAYSLYSWFLPAVAVVILVLVDALRPAGIPEDYLPRLGRRWCWFGHRKALLVFFALPMVTIIIVNSAFFIGSAKIIAETTHSASSMTDNSHHKKQYKLYLRLAVLMGFTWLSGILAGYLQLEGAWYVFVVLNTLQGVFVFLAFTFRRKVWRAVGGRCRRLLERGASWAGGRPQPGRQALELGGTPDPKSSSSPITTLDGC